MTPTSLQGGGPEPTARAAIVSVAAPARSRLGFQSQTSRRLAFGYLLLAPAVLYVLPDMFTRVARGQAIEDVMKWGMGEYRRIFSKHKRA